MHMEMKGVMNTSVKRKNTKGKKEQKQAPHAETNDKTTLLLDQAKYTLELVNSWIIAADEKVSVSCGVFSVMAAAIVFAAEKILEGTYKCGAVNAVIYKWFIVVGVIAIFTFLVSIFFHLLAINPSFKAEENSESGNKQQEFTLFYDKIRRFENAEDYIQSFRNCSEKQFEEEVLREVYINSGICTNKMKRFKRGIWLGWISILLIVSSSILYYCAYTIH